jgi:dolichol-phosphate mannosyltransferase
MDLSIIIPCYNEVDNVPKLRQDFLPVAIELAAHATLEVIFVDDGSRDGTLTALAEVFGEGQNLPFTVQFARHAVNRGLGAALRTGFSAAQGQVIVTTDSDGTYRFSKIAELLARLRPGVDLVTASPYHPQGEVAGVPRYRLILSRGSSAIYRALVDKHIHTYTALFRAYRRQVIERVSFSSDGFLAGTEILVNSLLLGFRVAEYPAVLHSRAAGVSKAKLLRTILAHLGFQRRIFFHQIHLAPMLAAKKQKTEVRP